MAHDGTGTGWDVAAPADTDNIGDAAKEIRDLRRGTGIRLDKEHKESATSSAGGEHLAGSAKGYAQSAAPTQRPDASTTLDSDDLGRFWIDTDDDVLYYWGGTSFDVVVAGAVANGVVDTAQLAAGSVETAKLAAAAVTTAKLADGAVETAKLGDGVVATAKLADGALSADATGRAKMADGFVNAAKLAVGAKRAQLVIGSYTGNGGGAANSITGVGFNPDLILIYSGERHGIITAVKAASDGHARDSRVASLISSTPNFQSVFTFDADGFTIASGKGYIMFNESGTTYYYVAIKESE